MLHKDEEFEYYKVVIDQSNPGEKGLHDTIENGRMLETCKAAGMKAVCPSPCGRTYNYHSIPSRNHSIIDLECVITPLSISYSNGESGL